MDRGSTIRLNGRKCALTNVDYAASSSSSVCTVQAQDRTMELRALHSAFPGKSPKSSDDTSAWVNLPPHATSVPPSSSKRPVAAHLSLPSSSAVPSSILRSATKSKSAVSPPLSASDLSLLPPSPFPMSASSLCAALSLSMSPPSPQPPSGLSCSEDFSSFPAAILFQVASFLHPIDVNNLLCTCTRWRSLCAWGLQPLWREFVNRTFGRKYENYVAFTGDGDWRRLYLKIARFVSNLKRGHAEKRRFPRLLLPPISNTYEGCLAMTTDCTRLLWENGKALQCVDVDAGKELWRVDLEEYRRRQSTTTKGKNSSLGSGSNRSAATNTQSSRSSTGRFSCCARASSVVIGRSMVFLHLEHQVHVYRLSDGTYVTTLCTPLEEGEGSATFVGNNMPLDVSLRNEHFTFLTKTALFVYHSESLELLYRIRHRELTPAMDTCEDIDFCWAGNRCCGSVRCFGVATNRAFLESSSSSERTVIRSSCDMSSEASNPTADIPFACCSLSDCVNAPVCCSRSDATLIQSIPLCDANTFGCLHNPISDKGKRPCEDEYPSQWKCDVPGKEIAGVMPLGCPSSVTDLFSSERGQASAGQLTTERAQRHLGGASCPGKTYKTIDSSSKQNAWMCESRSSPPRGTRRFASPASTWCDEQRSSVTARESLTQSEALPHEGNKVDKKDERILEICVHCCTANRYFVNCKEGKGKLLVGQALPCRSPCVFTRDSFPHTQKQLCLQTLPVSEKGSCPAFPSFCRYRPCDSAPFYPTYAFQFSGSTRSGPTSSTIRTGLRNSWITETESPLRSPPVKRPFSCRIVACKTPTDDEGVGIQGHQKGECFECGANKLSFRSRCQQSCRHIVTWLVKRSKTIKLWNIQDGANICTLHAHDAPIQKVRHVMNWKEITEYFLASLDIVGVVKVWGSGAREFCCLQELRPEHNSCVFRMSFSPTHLATMSKESPASEVVVTVWKFDQEKATNAMQGLQRRRATRKGVNDPVRGGETINSSRVETSGTGNSNRGTYKRIEDDRTQVAGLQWRTRAKLCSADYLKEATAECGLGRVEEAPSVGVEARDWTPELRRIEDSTAGPYISGPCAASLDKGKENVFSHCANLFCSGQKNYYSA